MRKQAFYSSAQAVGDLISATPTIRKLCEIYKSPITVISTHPYLFDNLPYVDKSLNFNDYSESELLKTYDLHKTFFLLGKQDSNGIEFKHAICDIRQFHAKDLGFMLTPCDLTCDYIPKSNDSCISDFNLPKKYVVIHPSQSWPSRTWSKNNWQILCNRLAEDDITVVSIGKNTKEGEISKPVFNLNIKNGIDLTNKTTLDQSWHILNNSICVITMDSGILHLAGTTDSYIVQLGSSIDPKFRAPYRNGVQDYKYSYVIGDCDLHCASDLKYSLRDWGHIQSVTLLDTCLEKKNSFYCNPNCDQVYEQVKKIWNLYTSSSPINIDFKKINPKTLVEIESNSLGDTIGALAVIEKWRSLTNKDITVLSNFSDLFKVSYPKLNIISKKDKNVKYSTKHGKWLLEDNIYTERILTTYKFNVPLLDGYASDFGISADGIELNIDLYKKERPIKGKYVCIAIQSTAQAKYWNYPDAWVDLCSMLRKKGLIPVCIDKDYSFGIIGHFNKSPFNSVKKNGMSLEETINYLYHCEMFIGLSSGLSWLSQALKKPTVIISNLTYKNHEYIDERTLRIYDETVCHGCFNKYKFDSNDWLWCPIFRNDEVKRFICTKAITPETVMGKIENFYKI